MPFVSCGWCRGRGSGSTGRLWRSTERKTSLATGCRSSSASWPISPAVRASRAKPRSSSSGRPRSARAAPQTPAPLSGRVLPEHLGVHPADRLEQREVRTELPLLAGDLEQPRRARVAVLVHVVAEAGHERAGLALAAYDVERDRVPAVCAVEARAARVQPGDHLVQEPAAVLGDAEESRATAEQPRGERALHRVGRREPGQPGDDRGRGEAVVGQRREHRLEDPHLAGLGAALGGQPEGQLAEADVPITSRARSWPSRVMVSRLEAPSAVGYGGVACVGGSVTGRPPARRAARRRARRAPAAAASSSTGVPENRIGCRVVGRARSPSPTSTTGSRPEPFGGGEPVVDGVDRAARRRPPR